MTELSPKLQQLVEHLKVAESQGLTIAEYSRRRGLSAFSLYDCRRRLGRSKFVRVKTVEAALSAMPLQVRLVNGVSLAINVDGAGLPAVLKALASL